MTRMAAREIAVLTVYGLDYTHEPENLLAERLDEGFYRRLGGENPLFNEPPDPANAGYISRIVRGVHTHMPELDSYIEAYAHGWRFSRLPRMSVAILRVAMFETLYMRAEIPAAASINAAVEISKLYEEKEMTAFINGILGTFVRSEIDRIHPDAAPKPDKAEPPKS